MTSYLTRDRVDKVALTAERDVAFESPDYLMPWGTRHDNFTNRRFNKNLWLLYRPHHVVSILDLGCAGGGFVQSCIDDGHFAIGLEGSDWSKRHSRAAWALIENALFTCDITRPFSLNVGDRLLQFDVITAWEVIEHIKEDDLPVLAHNVHRHLRPGGLWILSITNQEDIVGGVRLHQTVRPKRWWRKTFESLGFYSMDSLVSHFRGQFVRGAREDTEVSFHLILTTDRLKAPQVPRIPVAHKVLDMWIGSGPHQLISKLLIG